MENQRVVRKTENTTVVCLDRPVAPGNGCHKYEIVTEKTKEYIQRWAVINFQNGPIKTSGTNGCQIEDLVEIIIDRLRYFQNGKFACRENEIALQKLEEGLLWLEKRTADWKARGVEGKYEL
jgi:hypothetical protein